MSRMGGKEAESRRKVHLSVDARLDRVGGETEGYLFAFFSLFLLQLQPLHA